ncbi:MAG: transposase [Planctomycetota bacterium]
MALYDWKLVCAAVRSAGRSVRRRGRKMVYTDQQIVKMLFWTVKHDRPLCWGCDRQNYNGAYRPRQLPSVSQFCRRVQSPRIVAMVEHVSRRLMRPRRPITVVSVDGKALPVSDYSRDADATNGWGTGHFQRGYKLHGCVSDDDLFVHFQVHPIHVSETLVARDLLGHTPGPGMFALGDTQYDSSTLHTVCRSRGGRLLTPLRGLARSVDQIRRMDGSRAASIDCAVGPTARSDGASATRTQTD